MPAIRAVLLDLDGTLFDHRRAAEGALARWLGDLGVRLTGDLTRAWFESETRHHQAWRERRITSAEDHRLRMRDFLPLIGLAPGADAGLDELFAGYATAYADRWRSSGFDDVAPALADLRAAGLPTAVLTNGTTGEQRGKLAALGLLDDLDPVLTAEGLGVAKPDPRAFQQACRHLGLPPAEVLYVGDDYPVDVLASRAAGLPAMHLDRLDVGPHDEPRRIHTLAELTPAYLSGW